MNCNLILSKEDIGDLYNCVMLIVSERERNNMVSDMFEDAPRADPIIERLYALEQRLLNQIEIMNHPDGPKGPEYSTENPWKGISMPPWSESYPV
jgi:hypothetical protein